SRRTSTNKFVATASRDSRSPQPTTVSAMANASCSAGDSANHKLAENAIYHGDARELISQVAPSSVALSVWSPPYHVGKSYEVEIQYDDWVGLLRDVIRGHFDALKPGGFLAINIADIL